jgi:hypothetical protein
VFHKFHSSFGLVDVFSKLLLKPYYSLYKFHSTQYNYHYLSHTCTFIRAITGCNKNHVKDIEFLSRYSNDLNVDPDKVYNKQVAIMRRLQFQGYFINVSRSLRSLVIFISSLNSSSDQTDIRARPS